MVKADKNLLRQAQHEILALRQRNEVLQAKVDTMDLFALVLRTSPAYQSVGMGEDIAWKLGDEINTIELHEAQASAGPVSSDS